ncbi:cation:proton antiporter [Streptomyces sp. NPDC050147]|uniref:cation:proton antiporter n=1 Tax=Streptomyces sp. NPDC050147 TaxID=3155513 RepID=UPI0034262748
MTLADPGLVAPLSSHPLLIFLLQVGLLLLLAVALGRLARRLGMPAIVGELCSGLLVGPSVLQHLLPGFSGWLFPAEAAQAHLLDAVGQLGLLLLVGLTGMELDIARVRRSGRAAVQISVAGFLIPLGLGIGAGYALSGELKPHSADATAFALFMGVAMSVSAVPVIAKTLFDMGLLRSKIGQLVLTAGVVDDLAGWIMLSVVSAMATTGLRTGGMALTIGSLVLVILFAVVLGRSVVGRVLKLAGRTGEPSASLAAVVAILFFGSAATHALGLEAVFGAFVCGILIRSCGVLDSASLAPLRTVVLSVLAPVFFATAGLRMDLTALAEPRLLLAALAVLLIAVVGKFAGAFIGAITGGLNRWEAVGIGAGMNARGVIEVIVAMVGLRLGVLSEDSYTIIVLVAIVTSVMAPPLLRLAVERAPCPADEAAPPPAPVDRSRRGQPTSSGSD